MKQSAPPPVHCTASSRLRGAVLSLLAALCALGVLQGIPAHSQDRAAGEPNRSNAQELPLQQIPKGNTVPSVVAHDKRLVIGGKVLGDVVAVRCAVVLLPGAFIGKKLTLIHSTVQNEAPAAQHTPVQVLNPDLGMLAMPDFHSASAAGASAKDPRANWIGGQVALWIVGLLCTLLCWLAVPRRVEEDTRQFPTRVGRSLLAGAAAGLAGLLVVTCFAVLLRSPIGVIASPIVVAVFLFASAAIVYGWLCGAAAIGEGLLRRLVGYSPNWPASAMAGLSLLLVLNVFLGAASPGLGAIGLLAECGVAIAGIGVALESLFRSKGARSPR